MWTKARRGCDIPYCLARRGIRSYGKEYQEFGRQKTNQREDTPAQWPQQRGTGDRRPPCRKQREADENTKDGDDQTRCQTCVPCGVRTFRSKRMSDTARKVFVKLCGSSAWQRFRFHESPNFVPNFICPTVFRSALYPSSLVRTSKRRRSAVPLDTWLTSFFQSAGGHSAGRNFLGLSPVATLRLAKRMKD